MLHETNIYYIFDNRPKQSNDNKAPRSCAQGPPILSVRAWVWHYAWSCAPAPTRFATCETATHKREEEGVKEREGKIKSGREAQAEDAALSRLAMHEFISRTCHNQFDSMRTQAHVHTYVYVCVCVFSCAYSTIVTDYLLSTCFGSHHLGTASSLGVELWRCTQLAATRGDSATCATHASQWSSGREGNREGEWVQRVALSAWKMSFCHMVNALAGTGQGEGWEVLPWLGQLLDFPKHQTDYSLIKCAIAVLCCACEGSTGVRGPGALSPIPNGATSLVFLAHGWQRPRSLCAWGQFCFWL